MRIVVCGASGMLGHVICRVLVARQYEVVGTVRGHWADVPGLGCWLRQDSCVEAVDVLEPAAPEAVIERYRPDVVVNCVGMIKQKQAGDGELETIALNSLLPHRLARSCDRVGGRLVQISTDCVFSGRQGMYTEDDVPDATDLYGRSKLLGEITRGPHITLRTSLIGRQLRGSESLVEWLISQRGQAIRGFKHALFSGLSAQALARVIADLIALPSRPCGLFHVAAVPISKLELLSRINQCARLAVRITPDEDFHCDRSLDGSRFVGQTALRIPSWDTMITELTETFDDYEHARTNS